MKNCEITENLEIKLLSELQIYKNFGNISCFTRWNEKGKIDVVTLIGTGFSLHLSLMRYMLCVVFL